MKDTRVVRAALCCLAICLAPLSITRSWEFATPLRADARALTVAGTLLQLPPGITKICPAGNGSTGAAIALVVE